MANILLGVTGSVAAIYTRELYQIFADKHRVKVVATKAALHFFDPSQIAPDSPGVRNLEAVILDEDEWSADRYQRGDPVLHIELRRWADILVVAPLDANTLAKFAQGLCDNCLSCVYRAWDRTRPVVLAPAMNTLMWQHPATVRHLAQVATDLTGQVVTAGDALANIETINGGGHRFTVVPPVIKTLACADWGIGALADARAIVSAVEHLLAAPTQPAEVKTRSEFATPPNVKKK